MTAEELKTMLRYDPLTGVFYRTEVPYPHLAGSVAGGPHNAGYWRISVGDKRYLAHRLAWLYVHGVWPSGELDHINGDRRDNRIENLRIANPSQNQANRRPTSGRALPKGVRQRSCGSYHVTVRKNYKKYYIGTFETLDAAQSAYVYASRKLFGEFARSA